MADDQRSTVKGMYWFRRIHLVGLLCAMAGVSVLSLSDRAPRAVNGLAHVMVLAAARLDPFGNVDLATRIAAEAGRGSPFAFDTVGHFVMWAAVGFLSTGLFSTVRDRLSMLSALFMTSALFEAGQQYLSWSRSASLDDLVANGIGLVIGYLGYTIAEALALPRLRRFSEAMASMNPLR